MKYLLLAFSFLFLLGCDGDDPRNGTTLSCSNHTKIDLSSCYSPLSDFSDSEDDYYDLLLGDIEFNGAEYPTYSIESGSDIVFVYRHIDGLFNGWIDDENEARLVFQVNSSLESFTIDDDFEFESSNCVYSSCGAWIADTFRNIQGSISGTKISDCEWSVTVDLSIEAFGGRTSELDFTAVFGD